MSINFKFIKKMALPLILAIFFVTLDRFFKIWALKHLEFDSIPIFGHYFQLNLAKNTGIAFSIPFSGIFLNILIIFILFLLFYYFFYLLKTQEYKTASFFVFVILGAFSNLYDRLVFGYVIDYFDLRWFSVFNIADSMIVLSVLFLVISEIKKPTT